MKPNTISLLQQIEFVQEKKPIETWKKYINKMCHLTHEYFFRTGIKYLLSLFINVTYLKVPKSYFNEGQWRVWLHLGPKFVYISKIIMFWDNIIVACCFSFGT